MPAWSSVQHTAERVVIVASGPSLRGVDLTMPEGVSVIAVNAAIAHLPRPPQFWFTLDASPANRAIMAGAARNPDTVYYAAVPADYGDPGARPRHYAAPADPGVHYLRRVTGAYGKGAMPGLSTRSDRIHCGNSAYGALGLAYLMGAKRIALLGLDATNDGYAWGNGRPRDLSHLPRLFLSAVPQLMEAGIQVVIGSPDSKVACWRRVTPREAISWVSS